MMKSNWVRALMTAAWLFATTTVYAAVTEWQILPSESELTFTATQNGAPVNGKFKAFTGEIHFDPNQLNQSRAKITVNMASVSTSYAEIGDTLVTSDWFDTKLFPQAVFTADSFTKTGDKTYQAKGNLTIRNKTMPIIVTFTEEEYSATKARMKGSTTVKRSAFGVGQGEWASTSEVKDDVQVNFVLSAVRK